MNFKLKLIVAAIATLGLAACSPDITPKASSNGSGPAVSSAPAQPAAEAQVAKADQPTAAPAVQEEEKEEAAAAPAAEVKKDEGEKKAD